MKNVTFWRYYVPSEDGEGWGIFILDSTGMFAAVTDYGNCAYRWTHHGCDDFREFFSGGSWDYFLKKLFPRMDNELQSEETVISIKRRIIHNRRERYWTAEDARTEWDLIAENDGLYSKHDFNKWYEETRIDEAYDYAVYDYPASVKEFGYKLLPRLFAMIHDDLSSEKIPA